MKLVLVLLPKSGLGNKLYVWAQAYSFAHLNQLKVLEFGWTQPSLGPIMRRERSNHLYLRDRFGIRFPFNNADIFH